MFNSQRNLEASSNCWTSKGCVETLAQFLIVPFVEKYYIPLGSRGDLQMGKTGLMLWRFVIFLGLFKLLLGDALEIFNFPKEFGNVSKLQKLEASPNFCTAGDRRVGDLLNFPWNLEDFANLCPGRFVDLSPSSRRNLGESAFCSLSASDISSRLDNKILLVKSLDSSPLQQAFPTASAALMNLETLKVEH